MRHRDGNPPPQPVSFQGAIDWSASASGWGDQIALRAKVFQFLTSISGEWDPCHEMQKLSVERLHLEQSGADQNCHRPHGKNDSKLKHSKPEPPSHQ